MVIKILNPTEVPNWNDQIAQLPGATIFHTANWARVLAESYNYQPCYFTAFAGGQMTGCLPIMDVRSPLTGRRGVSLPFTDACHPLCRDAKDFEPLWARAQAHARNAGWKHLELRGHHAALKAAPAVATYLAHQLALHGSPQRLQVQFRDSTRRNIQKAQKSDLQVQHARTAAAMESFYHLNCQTRRSHGLPPQPVFFFRALQRHIIAAELGFVQLALHRCRPIAGAVFLHFNRQLTYKYGASDKHHQALRPNNLILWEALQWGLASGYEQLDLGRTEADNRGLRQFKNGWGTRETPLRYYRFRPRSAAFDPAAAGPKTSYALFQNMPMSLLKLTGQILYRHMG